MHFINYNRIDRYTSVTTPAAVAARQVMTDRIPEENEQAPRSPTSSMKMNTSGSTAPQDGIQYSPFRRRSTRLPHTKSTPHMSSGSSQYATSPRLASMSMDKMSPIDAGMQDLHISGRSPRIFPGVVSRPQRKDSLKLMESPISEKGDKSGKSGTARDERPKFARDTTRDYDNGEEPAGLEEWS